MGRFKNRAIAWFLTRFPSLFERSVRNVRPLTLKGVPWMPFTKGLKYATFAIVTTAGVHLKGQKPFNMTDKDGDPSFRIIPSDAPVDEYAITHDYYDHRDADRDINIVFPIDRMREIKEEGKIGGLAPFNYGFMGHIDGPHIDTLVNETAPEVALRLRKERVDAVLLTPG